MSDTYDILDEVPWKSVKAVKGPSGGTVGINANGFAAWITGPRAGQRIPLDAHGPWAPVRDFNATFLSTERHRLNEGASDYMSLTVGQGKIVEREVRNGEVVAERNLDAIPETWPSTRKFWVDSNLGDGRAS